MKFTNNNNPEADAFTIMRRASGFLTALSFAGKVRKGRFTREIEGWLNTFAISGSRKVINL